MERRLWPASSSAWTVACRARTRLANRLLRHGEFTGLKIVKAVTQALFIEQEPVGKRITARITLSDTSSDAEAPSPA